MRSQRQEGHGRGDAVRLSLGGKPSKGVNARCRECCEQGLHFGEEQVSDTKGSEPLVGSGMQQAHNHRAEQTVEMVRNHEGGT
jgi:hypothetical protein